MAIWYEDAHWRGRRHRRGGHNNDEHLSRIDFRINRRPGKLHHMKDNGGQDWERYIEKRKSSIGCKVEHPFRFVKVQCGFRKTVYRGIMKNLNHLFVLFASSNLYSLAIAGDRSALL